MSEQRVNVYNTRVRAHQTDLNGAMHHAAFLDIFDDARIETFRRLGYDYAWMVRTGLTPVIRSVQCEYHAPAYMDDLLAITVLVPRVSLATLSLRYLCRREEKLLALGHVTFAFVDVRGKPNRVPPDLRRAIDDCPALQPATSG